MIAFLRRRGMLRGILGGNRFWTVIWVATATAGILKRFAGDKPDVVYSEEFMPGDAGTFTVYPCRFP